MDERQQQIRGKIFQNAMIITIVYLLAAAFIQDFHIFDIEKTFGLSTFMILSVNIMITYVSCMMLWKDAYFGISRLPQMRVVLVVFSLLALLQDGLFIFDIIQGEVFSIPSVGITSLIMVNSISLLLWYKRHEYQKAGND